MGSSAADTRTRELTARDLVTTGVFMAPYVMFMMAGGTFLVPNPVLMFWMPAAVASLTGSVYLLPIAKVPKHGSLIALGAVEGALLLVTGMYWMWAVVCVMLGVVADLLASAGGFMNKALNFAAFILYPLSSMGSYLMPWIDPGGHTSYLTGNGAECAYMDMMMSTATGWMPPAMILATAACTIVSGLVGIRLLRRQFKKADATAQGEARVDGSGYVGTPCLTP